MVDLPIGLLRDIARRAVEEDLRHEDLTCSVLGISDASGAGSVVFEEEGVLCGTNLAREVLRCVDDAARLLPEAGEGDIVPAGTTVMRFCGRVASLLAAERVILNFLQRLSGTATLTRELVDAAEGTGTVILDTRKTTPLLRAVERYAVRVGGGRNHRFSLADGIMIKDNHIVAMGGVEAAVKAARRNRPPLARVCVEVETLDDLETAIASGAEHLLLDNFPTGDLAPAVSLCKQKGLSTEASGDMGPQTVRIAADAGVDFISAGCLTHSARALRISMDIEIPAVSG